MRHSHEVNSSVIRAVLIYVSDSHDPRAIALEGFFPISHKSPSTDGHQMAVPSQGTSYSYPDPCNRAEQKLLAYRYFGSTLPSTFFGMPRNTTTEIYMSKVPVHPIGWTWNVSDNPTVSTLWEKYDPMDGPLELSESVIADEITRFCIGVTARWDLTSLQIEQNVMYLIITWQRQRPCNAAIPFRRYRSSRANALSAGIWTAYARSPAQ